MTTEEPRKGFEEGLWAGSGRVDSLWLALGGPCLEGSRWASLGAVGIAQVTKTEAGSHGMGAVTERGGRAEISSICPSEALRGGVTGGPAEDDPTFPA